MAWDFSLNQGTRDLEFGIVSGKDEVIQRLITRLKRELGEWFLDTNVGLPWFGDEGGRSAGGNGILGSKVKNKTTVDLLIRRETLGTEGIERIIKLNTLFLAGNNALGKSGRGYSVYMEVFITGEGTVALNLSDTL